MAKITAFKGLRYNQDKIPELSAVTTPPYDVISPKEQKQFYAKHPNNVIRLELGLEYEGDNELNNKYTRAGEQLKQWISEGILTQEPTDAIYIYEQEFSLKDGRTFSYRGIICLVGLEEFSKGIVLPHEETLSKAKTDRFNLMQATGSNFSQIYSLYLDSERRVNPIIESLSSKQPDISFTSADDITQKLWIVTDKAVIDSITNSFSDKQLFIADGHHRYETALNYRNAQREANPNYTGEELYNYVMMFLVDMDEPGLVIFPTHRLLKDLADYDEPKILDAVKNEFAVEKISCTKSPEEIAEACEAALAQNKAEKAFAFYTGKDYFYLIKLKNYNLLTELMPGKSAAYQGLDVSILHNLILDRFFGIDKENMANQKNLIYTRSAVEAAKGVIKGDFNCCFMLNPTKIHEIKEVSLAKEKMPQKSTYFYPKLITGLVMNKLY